jgi:hypothetical protein
MSLHPPLFDISQLIQARLEFVREARGLPPGTERNQKRQIARSLKRLIGLQGGMPMPRYFFDIQGGHKLIDSRSAPMTLASRGGNSVRLPT